MYIYVYIYIYNYCGENYKPLNGMNYFCKVTNCSPNPKEIGNGNGPNKPNTINL